MRFQPNFHIESGNQREIKASTGGDRSVTNEISRVPEMPLLHSYASFNLKVKNPIVVRKCRTRAELSYIRT